MKKIIWIIIVIIIVGGGIRLVSQKTNWLASTKTQPTQQTQLANPAPTNCIKKGGKLKMKENKQGQYGICYFQDNRQCEERALLRGNCPTGGIKVTGYETDGEIYCAISGGELTGAGTATPMCKRVDGTRCNAQANLDGDCPDPYNPNPNAGNVEAQ